MKSYSKGELRTMNFNKEDILKKLEKGCKKQTRNDWRAKKE